MQPTPHGSVTGCGSKTWQPQVFTLVTLSRCSSRLSRPAMLARLKWVKVIKRCHFLQWFLNSRLVTLVFLPFVLCLVSPSIALLWAVLFLVHWSWCSQTAFNTIAWFEPLTLPSFEMLWPHTLGLKFWSCWSWPTLLDVYVAAMLPQTRLLPKVKTTCALKGLYLVAACYSAWLL